MYDRTTAIYCFIDDLLKAMQHREDSRCEFSDSEVVTTAIVSMLFFGGSFERARSFLHTSGMMPRMLSRSRLSERLSRLADLIDLLFHQLGLVIKELNLESRYSLDSFPVAVCDNIRISRCRLAQGENWRGYSASKRRYFYGLKVQVLVTVDGLPVKCSILPGRLSDIHGLAELPLSLPVGAQVAADSAYTFTNGKTISPGKIGCACWWRVKLTRSEAIPQPRMITSNGCAVALKLSLVRSPSCFRRRFMRRRFQAFS